jgi:hypothetical protein
MTCTSRDAIQILNIIIMIQICTITTRLLDVWQYPKQNLFLLNIHIYLIREQRIKVQDPIDIGIHGEVNTVTAYW